MNKQEFETYLNEHCSALSKFQARALDYLANKNQNRTKSARWNDAKVQRAADAMYDTFLDGIYTKLRNAIKNKYDHQAWLDYIEKYELLEQLEESVLEIEFE